jgi:hypothetical protein
MEKYIDQGIQDNLLVISEAFVMLFTQFPVIQPHFGSQISVSDVRVLIVLCSARGCRIVAPSELSVSIKPLRKTTLAAVNCPLRKPPFRSAIADPLVQSIPCPD